MHSHMNVALAVCLSAALFSQTHSGKITGRVAGEDGRGMDDVAIRLESGGTTAATGRSTADGTFTIENVPPGTYSIILEGGGVSFRNPTAITVGSGSTAPIDISFSQEEPAAGEAGELIIQAQAPTIQSDSSEVSRGYDTRFVRSLPLADRQNQDLISLMPGITPPVISQDRIEDPQARRSFNVNGLPAWASAYHQDGSYQSEPFSNKPSRVSPNESVQQLNIATSNFNGERGFAGGSWVNTITRPGTNNLHGSIFGLHTGRFFTARNPLNPNSNDPGFNRNQFGGSIGAPIVKNKTFIFGAYEALLRRGEVLQLDSVPTLDFRAGNFSALDGGVLYNPATGNALTGAGRTPFAGNRIPASSLSPVSQALLASLPAPTQLGSANNLAGNVGMLEDVHRFDGKVDHRFSPRSTGFFRYGFTHGSVNRASILGPLGDGAQAELRNHSATASYTHSLSNTLAAEVRAGYARYRNAISPWGDSASLDQDLAALGFSNGLPQITIAGFGSYGLAGNYPSRPVNNNWDIATNWNWHTGMHHVKLGAQAIQYRTSGFDAGPFSPRGSFSFGPGATALPGGSTSQFDPAANGFASFLLGMPTTSGVSNFLQTPTYQQTLTSAYATDTINLWQKLYLEVGVRYDVYTPLRTRSAGGATVFDPATNTLTLTGQTGVDNFGNQSYDLNNIAPRVGLVFRPASRLAFRAGYGVHYFPTPIFASGINQTSAALQLGAAGTFASVPFSVPTVPASGNTNIDPNQPLYVSDTLNTQTPYVQTYSAMIQVDMGSGFLLDMGYVGNAARQLPFSRASNVAQPGTGSAGLPFAAFNRGAPVTLRGTGLNSNYNSLQINLTKRYAAGLSFAGAYTYGKALDSGFEQTNPFNSRSNYGLADWDRKHILAISHLWQLPFGAGSAHLNTGLAGYLLGSWELNGILRWASGTPYTVTADSLLCNCPGASAQPALFIGNNTAAVDGLVNFAPTLFATPAAGTFGGSGRNSFRGPELFNYDLAVFRSFLIQESVKFELRCEVYNLTNSSNYMNPISTLGSPGFGRAIQTFNGMGGRQFQLGGRFLF